jgi:NAD(P)-dependent dehydrogenase (short-subunit alcohol dehydrogenase family)
VEKDMAGVFAKRTALVTGAASGIGRATALGLAAEGARLILLDINRGGLEETLGQAGNAGSIVCTDLSDPTGAANAARDAIEAAGGVDYLCNIAGITLDDDLLLNAEAERWFSVIAINLVAPALMMRVAAESMIARGISGRIVNVSSSSAFRPQSPPCYASTKAGILGLTRTGAAELGKHDINVNAVVPGVTLTPMVQRQADFPVEDLIRSGPLSNLLGRVSMPEDVAAAILFLCRPESRQITGQAIHTSAGAVV